MILNMTAEQLLDHVGQVVANYCGIGTTVPEGSKRLAYCGFGLQYVDDKLDLDALTNEYLHPVAESLKRELVNDGPWVPVAKYDGLLNAIYVEAWGLGNATT